MNVLLVIDGREAIPVRAIPFLTNGDVLSPAVVAEVLAGDSEYFRLFNGLTAHRVELGVTKPIPTDFWKNTVVSDIDALSDRIKDRQVTHADGPSQWRAASLECLPAGAFVWREEFEPRFWATHGPDAETVGWFSPTNEDEWITRNKESEIDFDSFIELDFDPFIPSEDLTRLVMEGFGVPPPPEYAEHVEQPSGPSFSDESLDVAESRLDRNQRRYQMCVDAGLDMPDNDYAILPAGINKLAKIEGVSTQAFSKSVKAHLASKRR